MKILLVEDDPGLLKAMREFLADRQFLVECAGNFGDAGLALRLYQYDAAIVDITLPGGSGLDLVRALKEQGSAAGVIIISARDSLDEKIAGLELGADDYLPKPFHLAELNARLRSVLRRRMQGGLRQLDFGDLQIYPESVAPGFQDTVSDVRRPA